MTLKTIVSDHIKDLKDCIPTLSLYPEMKNTTREVGVAIRELEEALKEEEVKQSKLISDDEIESILTKNGMKWNGDNWEIEDADLIPAMKSLLLAQMELTKL